MDLLSPKPFWPLRDGLPTTFSPLAENTACDVAIVGAGICGAFVATLLTDAGFNVLVLDRREVAHGSTAGNTGLMMYELDVMLHRLIPQIGLVRAQRAYRRCRDAIDGIERMVRKSKIDCGFERKSSLFLAANRAHVPRLRREFEARVAAGFEVEWWPRQRIRAEGSLPHSAAILSTGASQLDAYRLTYGLLGVARDHGARVHDRTAVTRWKFKRHGVELWTSRGARVRARYLVVATGYDGRTFLPARIGALYSTFAIISHPLRREDFEAWPANRALLWDTGDPYLYLRTTADNRAMIGGYDQLFTGHTARDRVLRAKAGALRRRFREFFPRVEFEEATAWTGTFGVMADGLPVIGQHPDVPHTWFTLGFGGNGTTFSMVAAEIVRAALRGETDTDASLFGFDR